MERPGLFRVLSILSCIVVPGVALAACSDDPGSQVIGTDSASQTDSPGDGADEQVDEQAATELQVESGFTSATDSINTRYTLAGARLTNPNSDQAAYEVQVLFNLVGQNGDILDTETETVPYVGPGASVPVAPLQIGFDLKQKPVRLEVQVVGDFQDDDGPRGEMGGDGAELTVKSSRVEKGDYGAELTAQVTNPTDSIAEYASWACIYIKGKKIVGGSSSTIVDPIPPAATVQFGEMLPFDLKATSGECQVITDL